MRVRLSFPPHISTIKHHNRKGRCHKIKNQFYGKSPPYRKKCHVLRMFWKESSIRGIERITNMHRDNRDTVIHLGLKRVKAVRSYMMKKCTTFHAATSRSKEPALERQKWKVSNSAATQSLLSLCTSVHRRTGADPVLSVLEVPPADSPRAAAQAFITSAARNLTSNHPYDTKR
jgi:hypothetical protein